MTFLSIQFSYLLTQTPVGGVGMATARAPDILVNINVYVKKKKVRFFINNRKVLTSKKTLDFVRLPHYIFLLASLHTYKHIYKRGLKIGFQNRRTVKHLSKHK